MVITDTGFWLALLNNADSYHAQTLQVVKTIREPLVTTWPVITETCYFLLKERGNRAQVGFIELLNQRDYRIFEVVPSDLPRISQLMLIHQRDFISFSEKRSLSSLHQLLCGEERSLNRLHQLLCGRE